MVRTYTLRLDNEFASLLESLSKKTDSPKSTVIKQALLLYQRELERKELLQNLIESARELSKDKDNLDRRDRRIRGDSCRWT
jgi:predicted DNA-binding protein